MSCFVMVRESVFFILFNTVTAGIQINRVVLVSQEIGARSNIYSPATYTDLCLTQFGIYITFETKGKQKDLGQKE